MRRRVDLCGSSIWLDASLYLVRIDLRVLAFVVEAFRKKRESFAKRMWDIGGACLAIPIPWERSLVLTC